MATGSRGIPSLPDDARHRPHRGCAPRGLPSPQEFRWLKVAIALCLACVLAYFLIDQQPRPSGGTAYGYTLGTLATLLILWLTMLGVRKRAMTRGRWSLKAWTSAHVYLGLSLVVVATLHTGFEFGWNVHTLAYALMLLVILSGIWGSPLTPTLPEALSNSRSEMTRPQMIDAVVKLDRQLQTAAQPLAGADTAIVRRRSPTIRSAPASSADSRPARAAAAPTARSPAAPPAGARDRRRSRGAGERRRAARAQVGRARPDPPASEAQGAARGLALRPRAFDLRADRRARRAHRQRLLLLVGGRWPFVLRTVSHSAEGREIVRASRIEADRLTIGRDPACDIHLTDLAVALRHATVERRRIAPLRRLRARASPSSSTAARSRAGEIESRPAPTSSSPATRFASCRRRPPRPTSRSQRRADHRRRGQARQERRAALLARAGHARQAADGLAAVPLVLAAGIGLADQGLLRPPAPRRDLRPLPGRRDLVERPACRGRTPRSSTIAAPATSSRSSRCATRPASPATATSTATPTRSGSPAPSPTSAAGAVFSFGSSRRSTCRRAAASTATPSIRASRRWRRPRSISAATATPI
jgi:hypothetical protein